MAHTNRPLAFITGASRGIGAAAATAFAAAGYDLVLTCDKTYALLEETGAALEKEYGVCVKCVQADMAKEADVTALFADLDHLDVLINNAGISYVGLLQEMSADSWHDVMGVNLDSCFYTSKAAIPLLLQAGGGRILNVSSVWGNVGASMEVAYSASKAGLNGLTKALAKELAPSKIAVNAVAFGAIDTKMNDHLSMEEKQALCAEIPADRFGTVEEAAQLLLLLAKAPLYLTGQVITMDGGWT